MIKMGNVYRKPAIINGQDILKISGKYIIYRIRDKKHQVNDKYQVFILKDDLNEKDQQIMKDNKCKNVEIKMEIRGQTIHKIWSDHICND